LWITPPALAVTEGPFCALFTLYPQAIPQAAAASSFFVENPAENLLSAVDKVGKSLFARAVPRTGLAAGG
jgi:hypothetical protein